MALNLGIKDFLSVFKGGARSNLYAVVLNFPVSIANLKTIILYV